MANARKKLVSVTLLFSAVAGLSLAGAVYVALPQAVCALETGGAQSVADAFTGVLLPLTFAFATGFFTFRLPLLSLITLLRFFSLTLRCCAELQNGGAWHFSILLCTEGCAAYMLLGFCRLSYTFGGVYHKSSARKTRYLFQYFCDYLFVCGICGILLLLRMLLL